MLFKSRAKMVKSQSDFATQSILISVYTFFIVISFRDYFFFIPNFARPHSIIAFVQVLTAAGWILLIILPPFALSRWPNLGKFGPIILLIGALTWPISTILIKLLNLMFYGNRYMGYLGDHPLFILLEYLIPAFYIYIWRRKHFQI